MNTLRLVDSLWQDLRFGARLLLKNRTFAVVAILTLALGTGANAAVFHLVNSVRLRSLPVERVDELAVIGINTNDKGRTGRFLSRRPFFSEPLWRAIQAEQQAFSQLLAWGVTNWNSATDGETRRVQGLYVSGSYFDALGVKPHAGRLLGDPDDRIGCSSPGAVLGHGYWQSRYGGSPSVIGQPLVLDGRTFDVIGVTPPHFFGTEVGRSFDVAVPLCAEPMFRGEMSGIGRPDTWFLDIMARLKPGWTVAGAQAQLEAISPAIFTSTVSPTYRPETAKDYQAFKLTVSPGRTGVSTLRRTYETQLWALLAATGIVVLIMCANLANLMLARATAREREIAVRLAIGASRWRIVRQMLSESLLIAALGAVVGGVLAQWLSHTLVTFLNTENVTLFVDLSPDWRLFAFIGGLAVVASVLFGLSPALKATGTNRVPGDAGGWAIVHGLARAPSDAPRVGRRAGRALDRADRRRGPPRTQPAQSGDPRSRLPAGRADRGGRRSPSGDGARTRRHPHCAVHGGRRSRATDPRRAPRVGGLHRPAERIGMEPERHRQRRDEGRGHQPESRRPRVLRDDGDAVVGWAGVRPGGSPRNGGGGDRQRAVRDESTLGDPKPIGRTFQVDVAPGQPQPHYRVIGVVRNTNYTELREDLSPIAYFPIAQSPDLEPYVTIVVRSELPLASLRPMLTRAIREVVPGGTVDYSAVSAYARDSLVTERLMSSLSAFLGALAMLIAIVGLYGVLCTSCLAAAWRSACASRLAPTLEPSSAWCSAKPACCSRSARSPAPGWRSGRRTSPRICCSDSRRGIPPR